MVLLIMPSTTQNTLIPIFVTSHSVNASLKAGKPVYARPVSTDPLKTPDMPWLRIDRYKIVTRIRIDFSGRNTRVPFIAKGRNMATGRWFSIDGANIETH